MSGRRGLTLLELLLVTAILGLVATLGAGALLRAVRADPLQRGLAGLRDADHRARLEARRAGGLVLRIARDGWSIVREGAAGQALWRVPEDLRVVVRDLEGRSLDRIVLDAAGRGPDLRVELGDVHGVQRHLVLGLSGQWLEDP